MEATVRKIATEYVRLAVGQFNARFSPLVEGALGRLQLNLADVHFVIEGGVVVATEKESPECATFDIIGEAFDGRMIAISIEVLNDQCTYRILNVTLAVE